MYRQPSFIHSFGKYIFTMYLQTIKHRKTAKKPRYVNLGLRRRKCFVQSDLKLLFDGTSVNKEVNCTTKKYMNISRTDLAFCTKFVLNVET